VLKQRFGPFWHRSRGYETRSLCVCVTQSFYYRSQDEAKHFLGDFSNVTHSTPICCPRFLHWPLNLSISPFQRPRSPLHFCPPFDGWSEPFCFLVVSHSVQPAVLPHRREFHLERHFNQHLYTKDDSLRPAYNRRSRHAHQTKGMGSTAGN
jgi:hypothetical protein